MILVVLIILLFILLRWYTNNYEKYEVGTDSYDIQVKPVEILDVEYNVGQSEIQFEQRHLRLNSDKKAWDLYVGSSQEYDKDTTTMSNESIFTVKFKDVLLDGKMGKIKRVPSYEYTYIQPANYKNYIFYESGDIENPILNFGVEFDNIRLGLKLPLNDLYVPIEPPTFDTIISNNNLDVTARFTNIQNPSSKYTISIHETIEPSYSQYYSGYSRDIPDTTIGNEIISYTLNQNIGDFSLYWKENSPGTKKYTVKLNGRTLSSDHNITIDGDDSGGIYKINKINFKWNNTNGVNETVEKWVIVVKKDGYAPLETKNIVKDDTNFFKNFTDTPNVELLNGYVFKSPGDISGIKIYLYYVDKNGTKTLLSTSEDLKLNREDFNMEISNGFEPLDKDTFTSRTWDNDIYTDHNKDCDAKFVESGVEYTCDDNADYTCQNWKYTISTLGIGEGIKCVKEQDEIITVNWPSSTTLENYLSFDEITDVDKDPNETGALVDDPTMYVKSFEDYRNVDGNNLDCIGSWERDGELTENCEAKDWLMCQDWKYKVTRPKTGTGKECDNEDSDELTVKYPSSDAMTLYLPPDDIVKWETVDDLNPNKTGALIGSSDMYVKPFEDYKNSYTSTEPGIQKELKIKESDIYRVAGGTSDGQLGYSVDVNDKYTIAGQPGNGTIYTYVNETKQEHITAGKNYQVAMSDNHAIAGAYKENKVYIYDLDFEGKLSNVKVLDGGKAEVLTPPENRFVSDNPPNSEFGKSVAISDDYAVVTVPQATVKLSSGAYTASRTYTPIIYIYEKGFDGKWETRKEITEDYGDTIAVSGNTIIIGGNNKVYIYERNVNGEWDKIQTIEGTASFGQSVSILDDYMLIGAPDNDNDETEIGGGGAYLYQNQGGDNPWKQIGEKTIHEDVDGKEFGRFGSSVSISDEYAIIASMPPVGGPPTNAYIYKRIYGKLDKGTRVPLSITGRQMQTSISNKYAVIGAYKEENTKGAVYIIDLSNVKYEEIENDYESQEKDLSRDFSTTPTTLPSPINPVSPTPVSPTPVSPPTVVLVESTLNTYKLYEYAFIMNKLSYKGSVWTEDYGLEIQWIKVDGVLLTSQKNSDDIYIKIDKEPKKDLDNMFVEDNNYAQWKKKSVINNPNGIELGDRVFTISKKNNKIEKIEISYYKPTYAPGWKITENSKLMIEESENRGSDKYSENVTYTYTIPDTAIKVDDTVSGGWSTWTGPNGETYFNLSKMNNNWVNINSMSGMSATLKGAGRQLDLTLEQCKSLCENEDECKSLEYIPMYTTSSGYSSPNTHCTLSKVLPTDENTKYWTRAEIHIKGSSS